MIEFFQANPQAFWYTLGFALLTIEALVLGMTTGVVLFAGLGALVTGGLLQLGWLPGTLIWSVGCFGLSTSLITLLAWKPLKALQGRSLPQPDTSSDLIGHRFRLEAGISRTQPGQVRYSGVNWRVELDEQCPCQQLDEGQLVEVSGIAAGRFRVQPVEEAGSRPVLPQ